MAAPGRSNGAVIAYCAVVVVNYFVGRQQFMAINNAGEGFLRDLRVRVFDRLQAQSMAFFDRNKAGVLVARMTADIESMGELIQFGLLQFVVGRAAAGVHADRAGRHQLGADAGRAGWCSRS